MELHMIEPTTLDFTICGFRTVDSWLQTIVELYHSPSGAWVPLDCAVEMLDGTWAYIVQYGKLTEDCQETISKIKRLPAKSRNLDSIQEIRIDGFEKELFFVL